MNAWKMPDLPHAGKMRWLEKVSMSADGTETTAFAIIGPAHPFARDGFLLPAALIGLMAQAAAAGSTLKARAAGKRVKFGVLAAMPEFSVYANVPVGSRVELLARHEKTFGALTQVRLQAHIDGQLIAEARMTFH